MEKFTILILLLFAYVIELIKLEFVAWFWELSAFIGTSVTFGQTPVVEPPMIPATLVPCPRSSSVLVLLDIKLYPSVKLFSRYGLSTSIPESITPTRTFEEPVHKSHASSISIKLSCPYFSDSFLIDYTENAM